MSQVSSGLKRRRAGLASVLALLLGASAAYAAATPAQKCAVAKLKATGAKIHAKTKCYQRALATGAPLDPTCLTKAEQKFVAAFGKAEAAGGCTVTRDASAVEAQVDACLTSFTGATTGAAKCAAAKMQAAGKKAYAKAKCHQKALLKGMGVDVECLGKAEMKFTAAITKADGRGTCTGTATALEALVDTCVGSLVPMTTTTTTAPTTTTTTTLMSDCFTDTGDGTIHDTCTGLQWEKKATPVGSGVNPADLHDVDNRYSWAGCCGDTCPYGLKCQPNAAAAATCATHVVGIEPTWVCSTCASGRCNVDPFSVGALTTVWDWVNQVNAANFAGHSDWRLPREEACLHCFSGYDSSCLSCDFHELETILLAPYPCSLRGTPPCIASTFGSTGSGFYWSGTVENSGFGLSAWGVDFAYGDAFNDQPGAAFYVRAVR